MTAMRGQSGPAVLVIGHPGHEMRLHHWLERTHAAVCVLTDGSGRSAVSRLEYTTALLRQTGARPGRVYGAASDQALYDIMLRGDVEAVWRMVMGIAETLVAVDAALAVSDDQLGYHPVHDLCALLTAAAVAIAAPHVALYDTPLIGPADAGAEQPGAIVLRLDADALARKLAAAVAYEPLANEVAVARGALGDAGLAVECLRPVDPARLWLGPDVQPPYYEHYGALQSAAGHYRTVLRYRDHMVPLVDQLWNRVAGTAGVSSCGS